MLGKWATIVPQRSSVIAPSRDASRRPGAEIPGLQHEKLRRGRTATRRMRSCWILQSSCSSYWSCTSVECVSRTNAVGRQSATLGVAQRRS